MKQLTSDTFKKTENLSLDKTSSKDENCLGFTRNYEMLKANGFRHVNCYVHTERGHILTDLSKRLKVSKRFLLDKLISRKILSVETLYLHEARINNAHEEQSTELHPLFYHLKTFLEFSEFLEAPINIKISIASFGKLYNFLKKNKREILGKTKIVVSEFFISFGKIKIIPEKSNHYLT